MAERAAVTRVVRGSSPLPTALDQVQDSCYTPSMLIHVGRYSFILGDWTHESITREMCEAASPGDYLVRQVHAARSLQPIMPGRRDAAPRGGHDGEAEEVEA